LIIAIGILALVGILSSIDGIKTFLSNSFNRLGSNSFNIMNRSSTVNFGGPNAKRIRYKTITYKEALAFKRAYPAFGKVSFSNNISWNAECQTPFAKTDPNVMVKAADENYLGLSGYDMDQGRFFTEYEALSTSPTAVIGSELVARLFPNGYALDSFIKVNGVKYKVIGTLKEKGVSLGMGSADRQVIIPVGFARSNFIGNGQSYQIVCTATDVARLEYAIEEANLIFRNIRNLRTKDPNNFEISRSDAMATKLIDNLSMVRLAAYFIAAITLFGAGIGLMNIMLVGVTERTREIGTAKAIGAKSSDIKKQFIVEAIVVCQIGGVVGVLLGMVAGFAVAKGLGIPFTMPWNWVIIAFVLCFIIGLVSGAYPAAKAAKLNPIDSLRYE
jgi:putative ABC transport system permease protein